MKRKLAVVRLWFEGNAFAPFPTGREAFERREWTNGEAALAAARGVATELAAVAAFVDARPDWAVTVLRCASANPGGPIEDALFDALLEDICGGVADAKWDAVYLSLHGAAITRRRLEPEPRLHQALREAAGRCPT